MSRPVQVHVCVDFCADQISYDMSILFVTAHSSCQVHARAGDVVISHYQTAHTVLDMQIGVDYNAIPTDILHSTCVPFWCNNTQIAPNCSPDIRYTCMLDCCVHVQKELLSGPSYNR